MKNNNQINVPRAKAAMEQFKMQATSEVGVNLTNSYNGHLTSREAGSIGVQLAGTTPVRTINFTRPNYTYVNHISPIRYITQLRN